ncbi:yuxK domain protein, partial [Bacteroides fragilis str. J-143-4]
IPAKLRDAIYLLVSKYRYRIFGKADSCIKPFGFSSEESKRSD